MIETKRGPGRPALPESEKRQPVTFRLPPETIERIKTIAGSMGLSQSRVVEEAVLDMLKKLLGVN